MKYLFYRICLKIKNAIYFDVLQCNYPQLYPASPIQYLNYYTTSDINQRITLCPAHKANLIKILRKQKDLLITLFETKVISTLQQILKIELIQPISQYLDIIEHLNSNLKDLSNLSFDLLPNSIVKPFPEYHFLKIYLFSEVLIF